MHIQRRGSEFVLDLDKEDDVKGLLAVMNNTPEVVPKEVFEKGQAIYAWLYKEVGELATKYAAEVAVPYRKNKRR